MPTLETTNGKPVEVGPAEAEAINVKFRSVMDDDGAVADAPPKRAEKAPESTPRKPGRPRKEDRSRTTAKAASSLTDAERATGVQGLAQIAAMIPLMMAKTTGNAAFAADAAVIADATPKIADACVQVAKNDARFAAALDRVCSSGPYAALIGVGVSVTLQCLRNHRPGLALPGTVHPDEILRSLDVQAAAAAA